MIDLAMAAFLNIAMTVPDDNPVPHEDEIKAFGRLAAIAEMASNRCADILINRDLMGALHEKMHIRPMDDPAVFDEAKTMKETLEKTITEAPSPQAWCDAVYRLYGPDGKVLRDLMQRQAK